MSYQPTSWIFRRSLWEWWKWVKVRDGSAWWLRVRVSDDSESGDREWEWEMIVRVVKDREWEWVMIVRVVSESILPFLTLWIVAVLCWWGDFILMHCPYLFLCHCCCSFCCLLILTLPADAWLLLLLGAHLDDRSRDHCSATMLKAKMLCHWCRQLALTFPMAYDATAQGPWWAQMSWTLDVSLGYSAWCT